MSAREPLRVGITLRNMGPQSTRALMSACARRADVAGLDSLWITDHVAIPPDDAEGSGGRYVDPLITLGWLAGITERIRLGTGVLILPYRRPLTTARSAAAIQELSDGRLLLGVGIGWMEAEFRALGIERAHRVRDSEAALRLLRDGFADDVVERNGQPFLFRPRPPAPPVLIGGRAPHALRRVVEFGDGWLPMARSPEDIAAPVRELRAMAAAAGRMRPSVTVMAGLSEDPSRALDQLRGYRQAGSDEVVAAVRYDTEAEYAGWVEHIAAIREALAGR